MQIYKYVSKMYRMSVKKYVITTIAEMQKNN